MCGDFYIVFGPILQMLIGLFLQKQSSEAANLKINGNLSAIFFLRFIKIFFYFLRL